MSYNQMLQEELAKGKNHIDAAAVARLRYAMQTRQQVKGRTIYDSRNPGAISI